MYESVLFMWDCVRADPDKYIERLGNFFLFASAILISISPKLSVVAWPFIGFMLGHIIWLFVAIKMKKKTLIEFNIGFLLLDFWAIGIRV